MLFLLSLLSLLQRLSSVKSSAIEECQLFLAESTIPNAGLGLYTGVELEVGDSIGEGDVCIPIYDLYSLKTTDFDPFQDFQWAGEVMGQKLVVYDLDIESFCPGLDCAINCHQALVNVGKATPEYDNGQLHRSTHPGAGAITPYHNGTTKIIRKVPAGGELFKDYGDGWFLSRDDYRTLPLSGDFRKAERLLEKLFNKARGRRLPIKDLYEDVVIAMKAIWDTRILNAFPQTYEEVLVALEHDIGTTHQPNATRSLEWLQTNGRCIDHITPGQSTIDGAGHGAFAKRDLPKGTVITAAPVIHIPFRDQFTPVYDIYYDEDEDEEDRSDEVIGQQLLLNYCFGNPETSLLLCPYGGGVAYINHNQTQTNTKVVWCDDGKFSHDASWFQKAPEEMLNFTGAHLSLEYVVTSDIKKGEEIFLDYGDEWEEAWIQYSAQWHAKVKWPKDFKDSFEWNMILATPPLRTLKEQQDDPYPENLQIRCHTELTAARWGDISNWEIPEYGYQCDIIDRVDDGDRNYVYNVQLLTEAYDRWDEEFDEPESYYIERVPRNAIRFFDMPWSSDFQLEDAFRHHIGLPDALMKDAWRNEPRKNRETDSHVEL